MALLFLSLLGIFVRSLLVPLSGFGRNGTLYVVLCRFCDISRRDIDCCIRKVRRSRGIEEVRREAGKERKRPSIKRGR